MGIFKNLLKRILYKEKFDAIKIIGTSKKFPRQTKYFTTKSIEDMFQITHGRKINKLVSLVVDTKVSSYRIINCPCMKSYGGESLSGKNIGVELLINFYVEYIEDGSFGKIYEFKFHKIVSNIVIQVAKRMNKFSIEELILMDKMILKTYVEDIYIELIDDKNLFICVTLFIEASFQNMIFFHDLFICL